jgi:hypothetical protein
VILEWPFDRAAAGPEPAAEQAWTARLQAAAPGHYDIRMRRIHLLLLAAAAALSLAGLAGATATVAKLKAQPPLVIRGGTITITGTGFRPGVKATLRIGRPRSSTTARLGSVKAKANGRFTFSKTLSRTTGAGSWVVRACQANCLTKASALFRVAKIKSV